MSLILIIDDEAPLRLLFQEVFIQAGYETVAVAGGREGLQWFARGAEIRGHFLTIDRSA